MRSENCEWAIHNFMYWAVKNAQKYNLGATELILAIVDPTLRITKKIKEKRPRFSDELNPFNDWMSACMAHTMRCSMFESYNEDKLCSKILITRIPSLALLSFKKNRKGTIQELFRRLPLGANSVWYFPCFDREDIEDIIKLWSIMKDGEIPRMPVLVAHHPQFEYRLKIPRDHDDRTIGIYAAAIFEMIGFQFNEKIGKQPIIPQEIKSKFLQHHVFSNDLNKNIETCKNEVLDPTHPLRTDNLFNFIDSMKIVKRLKTVYKDIFKEDSSNYLSFMPPDPKSPIAVNFLFRKIFTSLQNNLSPSEVQKEFGPIIEEIENPMLVTEERAREIITEVSDIIETLFLKNKNLNKEKLNWLTDFEKEINLFSLRKEE